MAGLTHIPRQPDSEPAPQNEIRFRSTRWPNAGHEFVQFFDKFVPKQYTTGFLWRCEVIGKSQEHRMIPFNQKTPDEQQGIARNADVLLEVYANKKPEELDAMRELGKIILSLGKISVERSFGSTVDQLIENIAREHHEKWFAQYEKDLEAGRRPRINHDGARPWEELPLHEIEISKVQTWANCRVLGELSDAEYALVEGLRGTIPVATQA